MAAVREDHAAADQAGLMVAVLFRTLDAFRIYDAVFIISNT